MTYPVYCFCVWNTVVQVPTGGDLKRIVISSSTGDCIVVKSCENCPLTGKLESIRTSARNNEIKEKRMHDWHASGCRLKLV